MCVFLLGLRDHTHSSPGGRQVRQKTEAEELKDGEKLIALDTTCAPTTNLSGTQEHPRYCQPQELSLPPVGIKLFALGFSHLQDLMMERVKLFFGDTQIQSL